MWNFCIFFYQWRNITLLLTYSSLGIIWKFFANLRKHQLLVHRDIIGKLTIFLQFGEVLHHQLNNLSRLSNKLFLIRYLKRTANLDKIFEANFQNRVKKDFFAGGLVAAFLPISSKIVEFFFFEWPARNSP